MRVPSVRYCSRRAGIYAHIRRLCKPHLEGVLRRFAQTRGRYSDDTVILCVQFFEKFTNCVLQGNLIGCRTGNGEKLSSSQAEPGKAKKSAVA